ncbi:MAG: hypothetical protein IJ309_02040 [Clostridia bacterium]|nr:hypothetical protein [Clostridia bacterium]
MARIYESIFLYAHKSADSMGEEIYTSTADIPYAVSQDIEAALSKQSFFGLPNIGQYSGLSMNPKGEEPNTEICSYSYRPSVYLDGEKYYAAYSSKVRAEVLAKGKIVGRRGGDLEQVNALFVDTIPENTHAVNMFTRDHIFNIKEIPLTDDDFICEVDAEPIISAPFDWTRSVRCSDSFAIFLVDTLMNSLKEQKPLYLVFNPSNPRNPNEWKNVRDCIFSAIELLPPSIANDVSFNTCHANALNDYTHIDLCAVPCANDSEYINELKKLGNVIFYNSDPTLTNKYATLLKRGGEDSQIFKDDFFLASKSIDDLNDFAKLLLSAKAGLGDADKMAEELCFNIKLLSRRVDSLSLRSIDKIFDVIENNNMAVLNAALCVDFDSMRAFELVLLPLINFYRELKGKGLNHEASRTLQIIYNALTYENPLSQTGNLPVLMECCQQIARAMDSDFIDLVDLISDNWRGQGLARRLDSIAVPTHISGAFYSFMMSLCFERRIRNEEMKLFFVQNAMVKTDAQRVFGYIISASANTNQAFEYILDSFFGDEANQSWTDAFTREIRKRGILDQAIIFLRDRRSTASQRALFEGLLGFYIEPCCPNEPTLDSLFEDIGKAEALITEYTDRSSDKIRDMICSKIINPQLEASIENSCFDKLPADQVKKYQALAAELYDRDERHYKKLFDTINTHAESYQVSLEQNAKEITLKSFRLDFVLREFSLLGSEAIWELLMSISALRFEQNRKREGITSYKDKNFREKATDEVVYFLESDKVSAASKRLLCKAIRDKRAEQAKEVSGNIPDYIKGLISSTILASVVTVLVAMLGGLIYSTLYEHYFISVFIAFTVTSTIVSEIFYWTNFTDRRLRSAAFTAAWQTGAVVIAMMLLFTLIHLLLHF